MEVYVSVKDMIALLEAYGPIAGALIFVGFIWMKEGSKSPPKPNAESKGLTSDDKLWIGKNVTEILREEVRRLGETYNR